MELTPVQISLWDIEIKEKPKEIINKITPVKIEKIPTPLELTELQQKFLDKNNIMKNENLYRLIKYCGGGLGIELAYENKYETHYINTEGKEEFTEDKKLPVLPMDQILYYSKRLKANDLQEDRLKEIKSKHKVLKEIRRKGDENIILELQDKVISINSIGWVLEFNNVQAAYGDDEVIKEEKADIEDLETIQKKVKPGDFVQAKLGKEVIEGTITRAYGLGDSILNIMFGNGTKHTAIGRHVINKIIKCA